ncbi:MAG: hypothetical protein V7741_00875 [Hyphomonas sp.]
MAWGMGFAVQMAPLFVLVALRSASGLRWLKALLAANFVAKNIFLAVMFRVGDLVSHNNIGLWQRVCAAAMYPWIAIAHWLYWLSLPRDACEAASAQEPNVRNVLQRSFESAANS